MSKTRKHPSEHEPRTRKKKVEAARIQDNPLPPASQVDSLRTNRHDEEQRLAHTDESL